MSHWLPLIVRSCRNEMQETKEGKKLIKKKSQVNQVYKILSRTILQRMIE